MPVTYGGEPSPCFCCSIFTTAGQRRESPCLRYCNRTSCEETSKREWQDAFSAVSHSCGLEINSLAASTCVRRTDWQSVLRTQMLAAKPWSPHSTCWIQPRCTWPERRMKNRNGLKLAKSG